MRKASSSAKDARTGVSIAVRFIKMVRAEEAIGWKGGTLGQQDASREEVDGNTHGVVLD